MAAKKVKKVEEDPFELEFSSADYEKVFEMLSQIEGIDRMLQSMINNDMVRFFQAPIVSQPIVRGMLLRTEYLLKKVRSKRSKTPIKTPTMKSPFHA